MDISKNKKIFIIPQSVKMYQKDDRALQERQNRLLYWQNVFTITLGLAQIAVAVILAVKFF